MSFAYSSRHWQRQPDYLSRIDFTHPLSLGFDHPRAFFYVFSPAFSSIPYRTAASLAGGTVLDASGNNNTLINNSTTGDCYLSSSYGITANDNSYGNSFALYSVNYGGNSGMTVDTGVLIDSTITQGTVYWGQMPITVYNAGFISGMWGENIGAGTPSFDAQRYTDGNLYVGWYNGSEMRNIVANTAAWWSLNQLNHWAFTWVNGQKSLLYNNGTLINTASNPCTTYNFTSPDTLHIGSQNIGGGNNGFGGSIFYFGLSGRAHSQDLIEAMASNPYQMLLRPRRIWKQATSAATHTWASTMGLTVANTATVDKLAKANIKTNLGLTP